MLCYFLWIRGNIFLKRVNEERYHCYCEYSHQIFKTYLCHILKYLMAVRNCEIKTKFCQNPLETFDCTSSIVFLCKKKEDSTNEHPTPFKFDLFILTENRYDKHDDESHHNSTPLPQSMFPLPLQYFEEDHVE